MKAPIHDLSRIHVSFVFFCFLFFFEFGKLDTLTLCFVLIVVSPKLLKISSAKFKQRFIEHEMS